MFNHWIVTVTLFVVIDGSKNSRRRIAEDHHITSISDHPYVVSIQYESKSLVCTGAIIAKDIVLTAAHCLVPAYYITNHNVIVVEGSGSTNDSIHHVKSVAVHENYSLLFLNHVSYGSINDIALIQVEPPFKFAPILLFDSGEEIATGSMGIVSGYGYISEINMTNYSFKSVVGVSIYDDEVCDQIIKKMIDDTRKSGQLCAGDKGQMICSDYSFGPLVVDGRLAGLASASYGDCGKFKGQTIFTKVACFRDWIDENVKKLNNLEVVNAATTCSVNKTVFVIIVHSFIIIYGFLQ